MTPRAPFRRARRRPATLLALLAALALACSPPVEPDPRPRDPEPQARSLRVVDVHGADAEDPSAQPEGPSGLHLQIESVSTPVGEGSAARPLVAAEPLAPADVERLLARLPEHPEDEPAPAWNLRAPSRPAPVTGDDVGVDFPPAGDLGGPPAAGEPQPLTVTRRHPEGEVPLAGHLTVAFSQPMVPLAAVGELGDDVPVRMDPTVPGRWRWLGTSTLVFEGEPRLPMATHVDLEVPAGTRSLDGGELPAAERWRVSTPAPSVRWAWPRGSSVGRQAVHVLAFDQAVDPADVLPHIELELEGLVFDEPVPVLPVSLDDVRDEELAALLVSEDPTRLVAFRPARELPRSARVELHLAAGAPSAEGPRTTRERWTHGYSVHGPLELTTAECGWNEPCQPHHPWVLMFSNRLDVSSVDADSVRVDPPVEDFTASVSVSSLRLSGRFVGGREYEVTVGAGLTDVFGQALGEEVRVTFDVNHAEPSAYVIGGPFVQLDPFDAPAVRVRSVNVPELEVQTWALDVSDWAAVAEQLQQRAEDVVTGAFPRGYGASVATDRDAVDLPTETALDLSPAFPGETGLVLARVRGSNLEDRRTRWLVVQKSDLAVDAQVDGRTLHAWVTDLRSGAPVPGAEVWLAPDGDQRATTDARGLARLALSPADGLPQQLVATHGARTVILPESTSWYRRGTSWQARDARVWPVVHAFDDRGTYKPGETAQVKGWVRLLDQGLGGDVGPLPDPEGTELTWEFRDARGAELGAGTTTLDAFGGFHLELPIPDDANLGDARVRLQVSGGTARRWSSHGLRILEFRRPEFEVTAKASDGAPLLGATTTLTASARYYAGGGLPDAPVSWALVAQPTDHQPPGWERFHFGRRPSPPWMHFGRHGGMHGDDPLTRRFEASGHTDATGAHSLQVEVTELDPPQPMSVSVEAAIEDVNRQRWAARTALLVHPASVTVGVALAESFVGPEDELGLELLVVDHDGAPVSGREIRVLAERVRSVQRGDAWVEERDAARELTVTSGEAPVSATFVPGQPGRWELSVQATDADGRRTRTDHGFWVSGAALPSAGRADQLPLTVVPSSTDVAPGDTVELLVLAPFEDGHGLLSLRRAGVVQTVPFAMDGGSHVLRVEVDDSHVPNLVVQVDVVGNMPRGGDDQPPRPAHAGASLDVSVRPDLRRLQLDVQPVARELAPGEETAVDVRVTGADGRPVGDAQVALLVVDEAVLALGGWSAPDPLAAFHPRRSADTRDHRLRDLLVVAEEALDLEEESGKLRDDADRYAAEERGILESLGYAAVADSAPSARPGLVAKRARGAMAADDGGAAEDAPVSVRQDLSALAVFEAAARTDADGRVRVEYTLPDNLTRYRVTAVAVDAARRAGRGESAVTARLPLMLRPSPPRFLSVGDTCELPLVVQNGTDADMTVELAGVAAGLVLLDVPGRRVVVPARDRVEVRLPARADAAGRAQLALIAADVEDGSRADAARLHWPVWTPATTEAFATYGELDDGQPLTRQAVRPPDDVLPGFGGLDVSVSTTAFAALTDAVLEVTTYPYGCTEQRASRMLAVAALTPVLSAFEAEGLPEPEALLAQQRADVEFLASVQHGNGGFGFWTRQSRDWPFLAAHVGHALLRAREAGVDLPAELFGRTLEYLADIRAHCARHDHSQRSSDLIEAYALWVRHQAGEAVFGEALDLLEARGVEGLALEASGWLAGVLVDDPRATTEHAELMRFVQSRVVETAASAHLVASWRDDAHLVLGGDRRADAVWLDALLRADPKSDLLTKMVRGLLGHRKRGHWGSTQENAWVLVALARVFEVREADEPQLVARAWVGEQGALEASFAGRSTTRQHVRVPLDVLAAQAGADDSAPLVLEREGQGRLYYRLGLAYAPADLSLDAEDQGFHVERLYEALDDPDDVRRADDGSWRVALGAPVRVTLTLANRSRRTHVALVDPLPAGFEAVDPELAVSASVPGAEPPADASPWSWWRRNWFEHQALRDERAEVFTSWLPGGVRTWSYVARATTPGRFVVGPAKAEEMYTPETFGRSATDVVVVE